MDILIFENQVQEVANAFNDVNILDFNGALNFEWITKSQDFKNFNQINNYKIVIVDIDLSTRSEKDGFGVIYDLKEKYNYHDIIIMTGHDIKDSLKEKGLSGMKILKKPLMLDNLKESIEYFM